MRKGAETRGALSDLSMHDTQPHPRQSVQGYRAQESPRRLEEEANEPRARAGPPEGEAL